MIDRKELITGVIQTDNKEYSFHLNNFSMIFLDAVVNSGLTSNLHPNDGFATAFTHNGFKMLIYIGEHDHPVTNTMTIGLSSYIISTSNIIDFDLTHFDGIEFVGGSISKLKRPKAFITKYVAIEAVDGNNKTYNIEVRNFYSHTDLAGVLYRFSFINDSLLEFAKNDIDQFPVRYVVFISRMDMMAEGMPTYTFLLHEEMPHKPLGDNSHVVFVNGIYEDDKSDIGKLMHDFRCKEPSKMYFDVLAKAVRHFKNDGKLV